MKRLILEAIHPILRRYFMGRRLYRLGDLDGQKAVLNYGRIVGYNKVKFELSYLANGHSIRDALRVRVARLRYDRHLKGWVYYD